MKHLYIALLALFISVSAAAQLPDGSVAPNWTATAMFEVTADEEWDMVNATYEEVDSDEEYNGFEVDMDGDTTFYFADTTGYFMTEEYTLYDLLDQGKKVIIDFSATWCGPCWSYHNGGALETIWEEYGPDGTDEVVVFFIEGDDTTTLDDLQGTGTATAGDWFTGTGYPIIDDGGSIFDDYEGAYYPTIYTVCPNRLLVESGQLSVAGHESILFANSCVAATQANDAAMLDYTGEVITCSGSPTAISANMMNAGLENLTSATLELFVDGNSVLSYDWTGNLETYGIEDVQMGSYAFDSSTDFTIRITTSGDMEDGNDEVSAAVESATEATTLFYIEVQTDNWGEETGWELVNLSDGSVVASVAPGDLESDTEYVEYVSVPSTGCYGFILIDTFGDGLLASQWGNYEDGSCTVAAVDNGLGVYSYIYEYDGSYGFFSESRAADAQTVVSIENEAATTTFNVYPNPVENVAWIDLSLAGNEEVRLDVVNLIGQKVVSQDLGTLSAGQTRMPLDMGDLQAGIYLVTVTAGDTVSTLRVTKK